MRFLSEEEMLHDTVHQGSHQPMAARARHVPCSLSTTNCSQARKFFYPHFTDGHPEHKPQAHPCQRVWVPRGVQLTKLKRVCNTQPWPRPPPHEARHDSLEPWERDQAQPAPEFMVTPHTAPLVNNSIFSPCLQTGNTSVCSLLDKTGIRMIPSLLLFLKSFK